MDDTGLHGKDSPNLDSIGPATKVSEHSSLAPCFDLASSWLATCVQEHKGCGRQNPLLPTRVIDIGLNGDREPFLWETQRSTGRYAALSYCWGTGSKVLKTTKDSLRDHKSGLIFAHLPKTLQHAVIIARRFKIPYLWIDALCIIQDDPEDWARESSMMCDVYSSAYLIIVASNSLSTSHGIFTSQSFDKPLDQLSLKAKLSTFGKT